MNRWLQLALVATLTFAVTWTFAARSTDIVETKPVAAMTAAASPIEEAEIATIHHREIASASHDIRRNLFAYVSAPPAAVKKAIAPPPVAPPVAIARVEPSPAPAVVEHKPRFDYRFIGRFGTDRNPIAAFVKEGEIVTARRGDRVGNFVLQEVGLESIAVAGDGGVVRVALGR